MYNYCTLFDSNYLTRGLAMYESLKKHSNSFHLYIFAFDDRSYNLLNKLDLELTTIISLKEFEDDDLLKVKPTRTAAEYCWTCTPSVIKYCIEKYNLESCTYLDADLYFYADPSILIEEMEKEKKSVLITEHRYTPEYDQSATSGIYCVQFMTFKNDKNGMNVLNWWRNACLDWCYARFEDGKFGDQKYLDDWPQRFEGIHVLQNPGGGVAPWNVQQYDISNKKFKGRDFELIFYHFHYLRFIGNGKVDLGPYKLNLDVLEIIYFPYIRHLNFIYKKLIELGESYDYNGTVKIKKNWKTLFRYIKRCLMGTYYVYDIKKIVE